MTIQRQLNKAQARAIIALVKERDALTQQLNDIHAAFNEQAELLRVKYGLPEGEYTFTGDQNGIALVKVEKAQEAVETTE